MTDSIQSQGRSLRQLKFLAKTVPVAFDYRERHQHIRRNLGIRLPGGNKTKKNKLRLR